MPGNAEKRTAIYARSNTNVRTTGSQLEACWRAAEHFGFDVIEEFIDEGMSGTVAANSWPGMLELMATDFYTRRRVVEENVRRIGVHTEGRRPKTAIVAVDLYNGLRSSYRFIGEDGSRV